MGLRQVRLNRSKQDDLRVLRLMPALMGELRAAASVCITTITASTAVSEGMPPLKAMPAHAASMLKLLRALLGVSWSMAQALRVAKRPQRLSAGMLRLLERVDALAKYPAVRT